MKSSKHGGKRQGAGRKAGVPSLKTRAKRMAIEQAIEKARAEGDLPLEYMLRVMRDITADEKRRDAMAIAAAPFLHAKLASIDATVTAVISHEAALEELE